MAAQNAVSVDHRQLSTQSLHSLPWGREQDCFTSAVCQMETSINLFRENWGEAFLFLQQLARFLHWVCVCSERAVFALLLFWGAELCYCSLNTEYAESEHLSEIITGKFSLLLFKGQLFVPRSDSAGFIYMCLLMISLFCESHQTSVFCVPSAGSAAAVH